MTGLSRPIRRALVGRTLLAVAVAACAAPDGRTLAAPPPPAGRPVAAAAAPPLSDEAARDTLARVIAEYGITRLPRACYVFEPDPPAPYRYTLREVHNARCGGDPDITPRIVGVRLDPATGAVLSDAAPFLRGDDGQDGAGMDTVRRERPASHP